MNETEETCLDAYGVPCSLDPNSYEHLVAVAFKGLDATKQAKIVALLKKGSRDLDLILSIMNGTDEDESTTTTVATESTEKTTAKKATKSE